MGITIIDKPKHEETLYEVSEDEAPEDEVPEAGPETILMNMRADLFEKTKENIVLITENFRLNKDFFYKYFIVLQYIQFLYQHLTVILILLPPLVQEDRI